MKTKILAVSFLISFLGIGYFFIFVKGEKKETVIEAEMKDVSRESGETDSKDSNNETRVIKIAAERFKFSQDIINIKKGEKVKIFVENKDINHGIMIPDLVFPPTQKSFTEIELLVDEAGEYNFYCTNEICGGGHGEMVGKIIVS